MQITTLKSKDKNFVSLKVFGGGGGIFNSILILGDAALQQYEKQDNNRAKARDEKMCR